MAWEVQSITTSFDIPYLIWESALITLILAIPLIVFSFFGRRWWVWTLTVASIAISFCVLFSLFLRGNLALWGNHLPDGLPYRPFRVGPSVYSIVRCILPFCAMTIWLPSLLIMTLVIRMLRRCKQHHLIPVAMASLIILFAFIGKLFIEGYCFIVEFSHEDTVWADGFTFKNWNQVEVGMTRQKVIGLLGQPFPEPISWGYREGEEGMERLWWVRNWSAGYFAVIWFDNGRVHHKQFWYSD